MFHIYTYVEHTCHHKCRGQRINERTGPFLDFDVDSVAMPLSAELSYQPQCFFQNIQTYFNISLKILNGICMGFLVYKNTITIFACHSLTGILISKSTFVTKYIPAPWEKRRYMK